MRGGFGRFRYERPQPGLRIHSYEDAIYPPRAYRYHVQQNPAAAGLMGGAHGGRAGAEAQANAIVLPTIDADAACGPYLKSGASTSAGNGGGSSSLSGSASAMTGSSSLGYLGRSASAAPSHVTDGSAFNAADAERRPPPRLRSFFDCFVPDEEATDAQTLSEVGRHAEPLNPFHYRELWGGVEGPAMTNGSAPPPSSQAVVSQSETTAVKAEPAHDEEQDGAPRPGSQTGVPKSESQPVKEEKAKVSAAVRAATRAAQAALHRTLRSVGLTEELSSMVLLAARVPRGGRLTRKQEKQLRIRAQRRPAPPRPIRRGAKVFMPAYALQASSGANADAYGLTEVQATAATGALIDVTAAGPRVLRVAMATSRQLGAFGTVGGGDGYAGPARLGGSSSAAAAAVMSEFGFDDDDDEDGSAVGRGSGGRRGKRSRGGEDDDGLDDDDDVPLIASGRWGALGSAGAAGSGSAVSGSAHASGGGGGHGGMAGAAGLGPLDEEAEENSEDEDDLSSGMAEDDDDDANVSSDGGNDSFDGGDDGGNDDY